MSVCRCVCVSVCVSGRTGFPGFYLVARLGIETCSLDGLRLALRLPLMALGWP